MAYRVDNIPFLIRPLFFVVSYSIGLFLYLFFILFLRFTLKIEFEGKENLSKGPFIYCIWHEDLGPFFLALKKLGSSQIWMNHPLWYMRPIHFLLNFVGIKKIVLGSTGYGGQEAAKKLEFLLKEEGASTTIAVDGPKGPPKVAKKGALHMAVNTGFPLLPLKFFPSRFFTLGMWDKKKCPLPFGRILVRCSNPIYVTEENFEKAKEELENALN